MFIETSIGWINADRIILFRVLPRGRDEKDPRREVQFQLAGDEGMVTALVYQHELDHITGPRKIVAARGNKAIDRDQQLSICPDDARRAARILETAVGEALGPAQWGGDRRSDQVSQGKLETRIRPDDARRAARILETAVGEALGPKEQGRRTDLELVVREQQVQITRHDASRFRT